jgi:hypothetical protein
VGVNGSRSPPIVAPCFRCFFPSRTATGGCHQPVIPLVGNRVYAVVVTRGVRDPTGRLEPDAAFAGTLGWHLATAAARGVIPTIPKRPTIRILR